MSLATFTSISLGFHPTSHFTPITLPLLLAQLLSRKHHGQERSTNSQRDKRNADETVLVSESVKPGRDAVSYRETHRVADQNDCNQRVAGNVAEAIDEIGDGEGDAAGAGEGEHCHCGDEAEPVDLMGSLYE